MPSKLRLRRRPVATKLSSGQEAPDLGLISFASDEEPLDEVVEAVASEQTLDRCSILQQTAVPQVVPYESLETAARDATSADPAQVATQPIIDGLSTLKDSFRSLQDNYGSLQDNYGSLQDNYGSLREMLAFQEQLTRRILERQDELEKALNSKLDKGVNAKLDEEVADQLTSRILERQDELEESLSAKLDNGVPIRFPSDDDEDEDVGGIVEFKTGVANGQVNSQGLAFLPNGEGSAPAPIKVNKFYVDTSVHMHAHESLLHQVVESKYFEYASAAIILTHSIFIAYYVEYVATINFDGHSSLTIINLILTCLFLGEVAIKVAVERKEYFFGAERRWNWFDMVLILLVVLQLTLTAVLAGKNKKKMKTVLKIAEMARTSRILRIFRFLKFCPTLQVIILKIFRSVRTLSWVMVLMTLMIWVVAVCFTQGANDFLAGRHLDPAQTLNQHEHSLVKYFGSVGESMKTCFASISGGLEWMEIYNQLEGVSALYSTVFAVYIFSATFAIFNILTGIFMNEIHRADEDFDRESMEKKMATQHMHLAEMFDHLDHSGDGAISLEEFLTMAEHPVIIEYLDAVGIAQDDAAALFDLLDEDGSGEITIAEFLNGSHALTHASTGMDMKVLLYESRHMRGQFTAAMNHLDHDLEEIHKCVNDLQNRLSFLKQAPKKGLGQQHRKTLRATLAKRKAPVPKGTEYLRQITKNAADVTDSVTVEATPIPPVLSKAHTKKTLKIEVPE